MKLSLESTQVEAPLGIPSIADPSVPLTESYTYHSPTPTGEGPYILGVDEAGRGPVLGPMVYGVAYCPVAYKEQLEQLGFADSKTLTAQVRANLLETLGSDPANLGWSVRVLSPKCISAGMLRRPPTNLNQQAQNATVLLIREVLARGLQLAHVYVDALGKTTTYEAYLSALFPGIGFTVQAKADQTFKIVGAASVAAKVTRDAWVEGWVYEEDAPPVNCAGGVKARLFQQPGRVGEDVEMEAGVENKTEAEGFKGEGKWVEKTGSGYPSDPNTQAWIRSSLEPTFGYPSFARFSWATIKVVLEKDAHPVEWIDDGQASLMHAFVNPTGRDKDRCAVTKDLHLTSVGTL
ncbi:ribonuclease H2 subunit A [Cerioporus squamosus]|nr:ribonuclease H2 subunit A [Cerioporus squamosus]